MNGAKFLKWFSLVAFCCQNSLTAMTFRYAMTEKAAAERYHTSTHLFLSEALKFLLAFCLLAAEHKCGLEGACGKVGGWLQNPRSSLMMGVPTLIYALQNALLQLSAAHLPAALWQVTYQGKILTTALLSVVFLRKSIKRVQWLAITIMGVGIAIVQLSKGREKKQDTMGNAEEQSIASGMLMLILACFCSSFAGIFTEMIFKRVGVAGHSQEKTSLWLQNMQMATYSMVVLVFSFIYETRQQLATADSITGLVFQGLTMKAWALVVINAVGGILVALVIKYADNILRGFCTAVATINSALLAVVCFGFELGISFLLGTAIVIGSVMLYGGVVQMPCDWWNTDPGLCGLESVATAQYRSASCVEITSRTSTPPETSISPKTPNAQMFGNYLDNDEEVASILKPAGYSVTGR